MEQFLNLIRSPLAEQCQRKKNSSFLRVQFVRGDEAEFVVIHFDIPEAAAGWALSIGGLVARPRSLLLDEIRALPAKTLRVTLECAGNGRGQMSPRYPSMPWLEEGVSTAEWTGSTARAMPMVPATFSVPARRLRS